jgi:tetratricopeptide (TPR) repeat protein
LFEAKLARTRSGFNRAQYLRIQGLTLVETGDRRRVEAGRQLLQRVIDEHPNEPLEVAGAHYALAQSFVRDGLHDEAMGRLRTCLALEAGANFKHGSELLLAEALIERDSESAFEEAWDLLNAWAEEAVFNSDFWRIEVARARLLARAGDRAKASTHARNALELFERDEPTFSRHPTVGRIHADKATVREMRRLANG